MFKDLNSFIVDLDENKISNDKKKNLTEISKSITLALKKDKKVDLVFICTHNSRRSHLGQLWAQTIAYHYKIDNINCYSGGTEATAVYPSIIKAIESVGFETKTMANCVNPIYAIKFSKNINPIICFSKTYDSWFNPTSNFIALMTCDQANEGCPFVSGATQKLSLTYDDPKIADGTPKELELYKERSLQIATEINYIFKTLKQQLLAV